jgi:hypothetical protein
VLRCLSATGEPEVAGYRTLQFGAPVKGKSVQASPPGRVCETVGCETVLSVYNAATMCSLHERHKIYRFNPRA